MEAIQIFENQMKRAKSSERPSLLLGIYKQLATSHKGKKARGQFREFVERDSYHGHDFVWAVARQLENYGLRNHADRLRKQYSGIPREPQRSWTEFPNVLGNKDAVEELCSSGDFGRDLAAFGAIASAFNRVREAERQPAKPRFLYPTSRQYPFDEVTYKIVKALEERDFEVPGIKVQLDSYGPSDAYRKVGTIEGDDFKLWFCRIQGMIGSDWNDTAAVTELNIPKKELHVYEDNSGPTFYLYVGKNWEADKQAFVNGAKVNSKLNGEPRNYLRFGGSWQKSHGGVYYQGRVAPFLAHDNDLGREYEPEGNEPRYFETQEVFQEFKDFLQGKLEQITQ